MSDTKGYPRRFRFAHWITAAIVLVMLLGGQRFETELAEPDRLFSLAAHSTLGTFVVLMVMFRIICRLTGTARPPDLVLPAAQVAAARVVQWGLYGLLLFLPVTGILTAQSHKMPVKAFGMLDLSHGTGEGFDSIRQVHEYGTWALMALLAAHIAAAAFHAVKRDGVTAAMNPFSR
jgi:cytochrome b561